MGDLRRVNPISPVGARGRTPARYYIDEFIERHADDIHGHVLECFDRAYTTRFGGNRVIRSDVLNIEADNANSTFIGDLGGTNNLPTGAFDCVIVTQVFQYIYDLRAAIATLHRILKPSGVILATVPGITPVHFDPWPWTWSLTTISAEQLFLEFFPPERISVESHGNVLSAIAFLHGLGCDELHQAELDYRDPSFAVIIAVRVTKPEAASYVGQS
jgi:SAM-dependent methyltransferase